MIGRLLQASQRVESAYFKSVMCQHLPDSLSCGSIWQAEKLSISSNPVGCEVVMDKPLRSLGITHAPACPNPVGSEHACGTVDLTDTFFQRSSGATDFGYARLFSCGQIIYPSRTRFVGDAMPTNKDVETFPERKGQ
jgi:hypothetical protein